MECPQCHGFSVIIKDGQKICEAKGCTYISFHVITYENENRQFEGEKGTQNRFTISYSNGTSYQKQSKLEKNYDSASKIIRNLAKEMGLSSDLVDRAKTKLMQILKVKEKGKQSLAGQKESKEKEKEKSKDRITTSNRQIAGFCLWVACFENGMFFKDVRIANQLGIFKSRWENLVKQLSAQLKDVMQVPHLTTQHFALRICIKRKINKVETDAMQRMIENIKEYPVLEGGTRRSTIAAVVFYLIMSNSKTYNSNGEFDIREYLSKKDKDKKNEDSQYWTQTHLDCSYEAMKKFKNEKIEALQSIMPQFQTRLPEFKGKN